jgi:O-acetyl-ADP-ribose deacetylase (regulator of RNase III)
LVSSVSGGRITTEQAKFDVADRILGLVTGDITGQDTDAIVNAANSSLMGGGGVDGAIHRAGGSAILDACKEYRSSHPPLAAGTAIATTGGSLRARYVIHTVGPVWHGGERNEPKTLASCYRESLRVADDLKLTSVAFPSISTGAFGYPVHLAAEIAVRAVTDALPHLHYVREVRFVLFDHRSFEQFEKAARATTSRAALRT